MIDESKCCPRCQSILSIEKFGLNKASPDGRSFLCKQCNRADSRKRYELMKRKHQEVDTYASQVLTTKTCRKCNNVKAIDDFRRNANRNDGYDSICKKCYMEVEHTRLAEARAGNRKRSIKPARPSAKVNRAKRLRQYALTFEDYDRMLTEQGGVCAACGCPETTQHPSGKVRLLAVDHDHKTGAIRGLLCGYCNRALGLMRDNADYIDGLAAYIRKYTPATDATSEYDSSLPNSPVLGYNYLIKDSKGWHLIPPEQD